MNMRRIDSRSIPNDPLLTILHQSNVHRTTPFSQSRIFYYNFCPSQRCRPQQFNVHGNRVRLVVFLECSPVMQSYDFRQQREQVSAMGHSSPAEVRMDSNSVLMLAEGFDEVLYPGELEDRSQARLQWEGIDLPAGTRAELERLAEQVGVPLELTGA